MAEEGFEPDYDEWLKMSKKGHGVYAGGGPVYVEETLASGEPPDYISPSLAASWRKCPRSYWYRYVTQVEDVGSDAARLGTFVHSVLEQLLRLPPTLRALDVAERLVLTTPLLRGVDRGEAMGRVAAVWELFEPRYLHVLELEKQLGCEFDGYKFKGTADVVFRGVPDGEVWILDWKTGKVPPVSRRRDVEDQLDLYAAAYERQESVRVAGVAIVYLGVGKGRSVVWARSCSVDRTKRAVRRLLKAAQGIREAGSSGEVYPAKPSALCAWCPGRDLCDDVFIQVDGPF